MRKESARLQKNGGKWRGNKTPSHPASAVSKVLTATTEKVRGRLFENSVKMAIKDLGIIRQAQSKLDSVNGSCKGCDEFTAEMMRKKISKIEKQLSKRGVAVIRAAQERISSESAS